MIEILTLGTASFIGGCVGGTIAALLMDKIELRKIANLTKRIQALEGYYGAAVSKQRVAEQDNFESQALAAAFEILAAKDLTPEEKVQKLTEMGKFAAVQRPDLVKKLGGKLLGEYLG